MRWQHWRSGLTPLPMELFEAPGEGGGGGNGGGAEPPKPPRQTPPARTDDDPTPGKETFSREYVTELRQENKGWRLKVDEERRKREAAEAEREQARADAEKAKKEADAAAEQRAAEAAQRANERIIRSELRTLAIKAGMIDLDGLKLADLSGLKLNDKDELEGGEELIAKLKEQKPYLFGAAGNGTSHTNTPTPPPGGDKPKKAKDMTAEEYAAARKAAGIR